MPDRDIDFALYNINGVNLLPGLDVFSNPFHCNAYSIADAFQYVCEQLVHSNEQLTEVHYHCLPIIHVLSCTGAAIAYNLRVLQSLHTV